jgi:hypothetical protein
LPPPTGVLSIITTGCRKLEALVMKASFAFRASSTEKAQDFMRIVHRP